MPKLQRLMLGVVPAVDYKLGGCTHISTMIMRVATVNDLPLVILPAPALSADFRSFILYILVLNIQITSYSKILYTVNLRALKALIQPSLSHSIKHIYTHVNGSHTPQCVTKNFSLINLQLASLSSTRRSCR